MSSTRLPEKVLIDVKGKPMLHYVVSRTKRSKTIQDVILATSLSPDDDKIEVFCKARDINCFRGDLDDVLKRFYDAALAYNADAVVRITADCPLIDPDVIDKAVDKFCSGEFDYVSNAVERTYPDGLDVEVIGIKALKQAHKEAKLRSEREHVTPYFFKNPDVFKIGHIINDEDHSNLRWVVDEPRDLAFVREVFEHFDTEDFVMDDILKVVQENPQLSKLNDGIVCNEGLIKSMREDVFVR
ncbi:glycosyltransferase family protein [Patescibacteria group bacterium]|nr:glycosyltransferase family protein [Patescibacteria group bacterium]